MVDIYYPPLNKSNDHVGRFFERSPAKTSSVLYEDTVGAMRFGFDAIDSIATNIFPSGDFMTAEEWRGSKYFRETVKIPEQGVYESVAESLADAYDRRFRRDLTLNNARRGFGLGAARFGASIVGSVLDPVNVGLALVAPVALGYSASARAATAAVQAGVRAKAGRTAAAVVTGAGEATVGALAFEPVALIGSSLQQDPDYGLFDSFVNLTAGAILGGAVGGVTGRAKTRRLAALETAAVISRSEPETVMESLRVATAQLSEGLPVKVDAIQNTDAKVGPALKAEAQVKRDQSAAKNVGQPRPKPNEVPDILKHAYLIDKNTGTTKTPKTLTQFVKDKGRISTESVLQGDLKKRLDQGSFGVRSSKAKGGVDIEDMALAAQEAGYFDTPLEVRRIEPEELIDALEQESIGGKKIFSRFDDDVQAYEDALAYDDLAYQLNIDPRGMTEQEFFEEVNIRQNALTEQEALEVEASKGPGVSKEEMDAEIAYVRDVYFETQGDLEEFPTAMEEMELLTKQYNTRVASEDARISAADKDLEVLAREISALRANNLITDSEMAEISEFDQLLTKADDIQEIAEAGAMCVVRS